MTPTEFKHLVRRMRTAQRQYYAFDSSKDPAMKRELLIAAKELEAEVDKCLASVEAFTPEPLL